MKNKSYEWSLPLTSPPYLFVGRKPVAVLFGDEHTPVKSWREVYHAILIRCIENPKHRKTLMDLRERIAGKCRVLISASPDGMTRPLKIAEELYGETHYGSQTLMHILIERILLPVGFDCSGISIVLKTKRRD